MFADLHTHSIYSDGKYTPDELCRLAKARGLSLLSITDHDTLTGEEVKRAAAKKYGLQYLSGWEISAYADREKMHILGYGCEIGDGYYAFMNARKKASLLRAEDSVLKFQAAGVPVTIEEVLAERSSSDVPAHTMHVARAAAKKLGISEGECYLKYLNIGKVAHSDIGRPTPEEAIDCIHACGGVASIAHPGRITLDFAEREKMLSRLIKYGADGIECYYTTHTEEETEYFVRLAKQWGLLLTGGSDTHYEEKTHKVGFPLFTPEKELLERLKL